MGRGGERGREGEKGGVTGVCEKNTPFRRSSAMQSRGRNYSPAPDSVFFKLTRPRILFSGGMFFSRAPVERERRDRAVYRYVHYHGY